jgi:hypothetical protein
MTGWLFSDEAAAFACCECGFVATTKSALSNHLRSHGIIKSPYAELKPIKRRRRPTNATKLDVVEQFREYQLVVGQRSRTDFINYIGFDKASVSRWIRSARLAMVATLPDCASKKRLRNVVSADRSFFRREQDQLFERFVYRRRAKGQEVDYEWLKFQMRDIMSSSTSPKAKDFKYSHGWATSFVEHYRISCQMQTEKKPVSNTMHVPILQEFHTDMCVLQQSPGSNEPDPTYGRFSPLFIFNVDQIPANLVDGKRRSLNLVGEACWILNQGPSGIAKRSMTIILTLRAAGEQIIPPFVLFQGQGHLDPAILAELDAQGIPYAFNEKAWANEAVCIEHLQFLSRIFREKCPEAKECMLLLDGLSSQCTDRFVELALDLNIVPVYFPPNCTHLVQPVDHRVAAWLKKAWHTLFLIEEDERYDLWDDYRNNGSMSAQYIRVTSLKWTRLIWESLQEQPEFLSKAFTSTGCLITLKGEHDIKFLDIDNYSFEYPTQGS